MLEDTLMSEPGTRVDVSVTDDEARALAQLRQASIDLRDAGERMREASAEVVVATQQLDLEREAYTRALAELQRAMNAHEVGT